MHTKSSIEVRWANLWTKEERALPTGKEECDEAGFFGHVQLEAGTTEDVFYHRFWAAGSLQEGQELLGFLCLLTKKERENSQINAKTWTKMDDIIPKKWHQNNSIPFINRKQ